MSKDAQILLIAVILVALGMAIWIYPQARYARVSNRIIEKVGSLRDHRPRDFSVGEWEEVVAWAGIAAGNVLYPGASTPYESMCKFESQLDEKLKGEIGLDTIHWIGEGIEETGPQGYRYMNISIKWWKQWDRTMEKIERERKEAAVNKVGLQRPD